MDDKTNIEWTQDIIRITTEIKTNYPELSKYVDEMPVSLNSINAEDKSPNNMKEYYESLEMLIKKYKETHIPAV
ncbi:MAG: hypothetical protein IPN86_19300 [Saprospiraceae bacterium]|nr:hypothetical protein [Saprospiraceae bacterium]